jgi:RNA-directed DNA polymerase
MKQTSLQGIANKAAQDKAYRFKNLFGVLTAGFLFWCWDFINRKASAGVDKLDAIAYEECLIGNIQQLAQQVKEGTYRAKLVLRKYIPKVGGKLRPLGIPAIADKLLQLAVAKILEAIYEQDFLSCSYGYRPGTSAHIAIKDLTGELKSGQYHVVVEADIKGFFNAINHDMLMDMLAKRIDDKPFLNLIRKWLKAGVLETDGQVLHPLMGTPQGGSLTPLTQKRTFIALCRILLGRRFRCFWIADCRRSLYRNRMLDRNQIFSHNHLFDQQPHDLLALTNVKGIGI